MGIGSVKKFLSIEGVTRPSVAYNWLVKVKDLFVCIGMHGNWICMAVKIKIECEFPKINIKQYSF